MFWNLREPDSEQELASAPEDEEIEFERVYCPVNPAGHNGVRGRISPLSVVLPNSQPQDFVWTWGGECLVQEHVLYLFKMRGLTGYEAIPVPKVKFAQSSGYPPRLWEIIVKGSGGIAASESGVRVRRVCLGCGLTDYSRVTKSTKLIDITQWDGSDFFRVKPVSGFIFVTDRVIQCLRENGFT